MEQRYSFFCSLLFSLFTVSVAGVMNNRDAGFAAPLFRAAGSHQSYAGTQDTTGKEFKPHDPFPSEKQFIIHTVLQRDSLLQFQKGDVIRISTKNGLKHYRNKHLLNVYKIMPQLSIITIQPQCHVAPCPPMDIKAIVYYLGNAERFIDIRNNTFLISEDIFKDANTPTTAIKFSWKKAYGLTAK